MIEPLMLTIKLALLTSTLLLLVATPLAWWLSNTRSVLRPLVEAITALPLVLPPTVLGFYLLILFSPDAPLGAFWLSVTGDTLAFSFEGLVLASILYSLPFAVQPLTSAIDNVDERFRDFATVYGASAWQQFRYVSVPLAKRGFLIAFILSFAHTLGEFGVVLMVGGNIPGETRLISLALYEEVETLNYAAAHSIAGALLLLSLALLVPVYTLNRKALLRV